jgi:hypothetical protein
MSAISITCLMPLRPPWRIGVTGLAKGARVEIDFIARRS